MQLNINMQLNIETNPYDIKALGKPTAAIVTFHSTFGELEWQPWVGAPGEEGILQVTASPNDIVYRGQKNLAEQHTQPEFYRVTESGELERFPSRAAAYKHWIAQQNAEPSTVKKEARP